MKGCRDVVEILHYIWWGGGVYADGTDEGKIEVLWVPINGVHADCQLLPQQIVEKDWKVIGMKSL